MCQRQRGNLPIDRSWVKRFQWEGAVCPDTPAEQGSDWTNVAAATVEPVDCRHYDEKGGNSWESVDSLCLDGRDHTRAAGAPDRITTDQRS